MSAAYALLSWTYRIGAGLGADEKLKPQEVDAINVPPERSDRRYVSGMVPAWITTPAKNMAERFSNIGGNMRNRLYIAIAASLISAPLLAGGMHGEMKADLDGDGSITQAEFDAYVTENGLYADFDVNDDDFIDEDEFGAIDFDFGDDAKAYGDWDMDADSRLSNVEFRSGLFKSFDDDENGHWDGDEWDDAGDAGLFDV
jgi:hypothetical protein